MTWREIKRAAEVSGIKEDDDLSGIQCEQQRGKRAYSVGNENVTKCNHFFYLALGINFD